MKKALRIFAFSLMIVAIVGSINVLAQSFKGTVLGKVTDAAGATIPGATVTITQQATNFTQTTTTNEGGEYVIPQLQPGNYVLKIEAANFKTVVNSNLVVETQQDLRFDVALEAGNISETVTVEDTPSPINTETSSKGEVITQRQVQDLPLNGRNFTDLALLTPGVYKRPADDDQGEGLATSGTRTDASNFILDGAVNRSDRNASVGVNTSVDSIREFKVETSTYSAEFGRTAGAQINVVTKSGANKFHGSLFDYLRNDIFDAKNALAIDIPQTPVDESEKTLRRNQFGGTIGGPLPFFNFGEGGKIFDTDSSFFFFSYEGTRERRSVTRESTAPNENWLQGDFRNIRGAGADGILNNADDTGRVLCLTTAGAQVECPTRNVIPFAAVPGNPTILPANPLSLQILKFLPAANVPGSLSRYIATLNGSTNRDQFTVRTDHKFSDTNSAYFRYSLEKGDGFDPFPSSRNFYPGFGRDTTRNLQSMVLSDTQIFGPKLINEARFGAFFQKNENLGENRDTDYVTQFDFQNGLSTGTQVAFQGFPAIRIDGFSEFGDRPNDPFIYNLKNFQFYDSLAAIVGNHSIKLGVDIIRSNYVEADVRNIRGDFRFRGRNTVSGGAATAGANSFADFLYGLPDATQSQVGANPADLTGTQYAFFVQDDWRAANWLTLNLGLRYEYQTALTEAEDRLSNFIPELGTVVISGDPRFPRGLINPDKNNFGPRVGFAMRPFGDNKTVIRGGAGIYFSMETFNPIRQQLAISYPFIQRQTFNRNSNNRLFLTFQNPFPTNVGALSGLNTPFGMPTDFNTPEFYQFNLTLEREIVQDLVLEVGYVGSQGRFLGIRYNLNQPFLNANGTLSSVRPFTDCGRNPLTGAAVSCGDIQYQSQIANSNYNAFQTSLRRRATAGLTLLASYTFSKSMDDASSTNNSTTGTQKFPQDIRNLKAERALSDFHRKHQFSASFNYELPIGKGRMFLSDAGGVTNFLLGGWQINGIVSLLSGRPFTSQFDSPDVSSQRPDLIGDPYENIPDGFMFNPYAFARPVATNGGDQYGNAGRNILIGPSFKSVDLSLQKNFRVTESSRVQFRWEVFNAFNHPNYQVPTFLLPTNIQSIPLGTLRSTTNIGRPTATANEGREMQFALKFLF